MNNEIFLYLIIGFLMVLVIVLFVVLLTKKNNANDNSLILKDYIDYELETYKMEQRQHNQQMLQSIDQEIEQKQAEQRQTYAQLLQAITDIKNNTTKDLLDFNNKMTNNMSTFSDRTVNTLNQLENRLNENIKSNYKANSETFTKIQERLTKIDTAQKNIEDLSKDINSLQSILADKKNRGTFGEIELYSLLESAYGIDDSRWVKQYHFDNGAIADAAIIGGSSLGIICVDSKFPLENYRRIYDENIAKEDREKAKNTFCADVKKHINDIKEKYIIPGMTSEFAFMFIPAEAIFAEIYGNHQDLCDYSYKTKVYMVSPTTLMAYLTAIKSIYLGQQREEKAKEILKELAYLSEDFRRLSERNDKLYKQYLDLNKSFNEFNTSTDKIIKRFDKINSGSLNEED